MLSPYNLTYSELINKFRMIPDELARKIDSNLNLYQYPFESQFLIFGIDSIPHIYTVHQNGEYTSSDLEGYAIVGSGSFLAFPELTKYPHNLGVPLTDAIVRVYTAKKVAERVGGVGKFTDIGVLWINPEKEVVTWMLSEGDKKFLDDKIENMRIQEVATIAGFTNDLFARFTSGSTKKEPESLQ